MLQTTSPFGDPVFRPQPWGFQTRVVHNVNDLEKWDQHRSAGALAALWECDDVKRAIAAEVVTLQKLGRMVSRCRTWFFLGRTVPG